MREHRGHTEQRRRRIEQELAEDDTKRELVDKRVERENVQLEAEMAKLLPPDDPMEEERDDHDDHKEEDSRTEEDAGMLGKLKMISTEGTHAERMKREVRKMNEIL